MYKGQYSITFESLDTGLKRNTWEDWHLIPASPPMVNPPEAYTNYVDIPGRKQGPLDLSEVLSEGPVFLNTEGSWDFIWSAEYCPDMSRPEAFRTVTQFLHGRRFRITLQEDPDTSYIGRIQVSDPKPGNTYSTITINYTIQPTNDNPLDVDGSNYTSNSGEIPWYSGPINQSTGGGNSGGGSGGGSGGSDSGSSKTEYNKGWNAALDACTKMTAYTGTYKSVFNEEDQLWENVVIEAKKVTVYMLPSRKAGSGQYDKGWNEALDGAKGGFYWVGQEEAATSYLRNATQVYRYTIPGKK